MLVCDESGCIAVWRKSKTILIQREVIIGDFITALGVFGGSRWW